MDFELSDMGNSFAVTLILLGITSFQHDNLLFQAQSLCLMTQHLYSNPGDYNIIEMM